MMLKMFRSAGIGVIAASVVLVACERHVDDPHFGTVDRVEVSDRATGTVYLESHGDHWDGPGIPHLHVGEEIALNVRFFDVHGNEAHLGRNEEFSVNARLATQVRDGVDGADGIVAFEPHGDHVDVEGVAEGETYLVFQLWHGGHSDFDTMPVEFEVDDH